MNYRGHKISPERNTTNWQIRDERGAYLVTRPTQEACADWIDRRMNQLAPLGSPTWRDQRPNTARRQGR
jgi:hypothetical protein